MKRKPNADPLTPEEVRLVRHIAGRKPSAAPHLLEYILERLEAPSPPRPAAGDARATDDGEIEQLAKVAWVAWVGPLEGVDGCPPLAWEYLTDDGREACRRTVLAVLRAAAAPQPAAGAAVDPGVPRRFRWIDTDVDGQRRFGCYWPTFDATAYWAIGGGIVSRSGLPTELHFPGLEWLDPEPAGAVTAGGVTLPSETDGESAAAKLLARVAAIEAVEADRPIRLAAGDDPHGGPVS